MKQFKINRDRGERRQEAERNDAVLSIESICINNDGDAATGSIHFRKNFTQDMPQKFERASGSGEIHNIVGVLAPRRLECVRMTVEVKNSGPVPVTASIVAVEEPGKDPLLGPVVIPEREYAPGATVSLEVELYIKKLLSPVFPRRINSWTWLYKAGDVEMPLLKADYTIYTLFDLPMTPWNSDVEPYNKYDSNYVWLELLDVCAEAVAQYEQTAGQAVNAYLKDQVAVLTAITEFLNKCPAFRYDTEAGACFYTGGLGEVKLTKFLRDLKDTGTKHRVNCRDCAYLLVTQALAMGIPVNVGRIESPFSAGFNCNEIIPIGCDKEMPNWQKPFSHGSNTGRFAYHAVMVSADMQPSEYTEVFDACLKIDEGDYPGAHVSGKKRPYMPAFYTFAGTRNVFVDVPADEPYRGSCYRERLIEDGSEGLIVTMSRPRAISDYLGAAAKLEPERTESPAETAFRKRRMEAFSISEERALGQAEESGNRTLVDELYLPPFLQTKGVGGIEKVEDGEKHQVWTMQAENAGEITIDAYRADGIGEAVTYLGICLAGFTTTDIKRNEDWSYIDVLEIGSGIILFRDRNLVCTVRSETGMPVAWDVCERILSYNDY